MSRRRANSHRNRFLWPGSRCRPIITGAVHRLSAACIILRFGGERSRRRRLSTPMARSRKELRSTNMKLGILDAETGDAIAKAADEVYGRPHGRRVSAGGLADRLRHADQYECQ